MPLPDDIELLRGYARDRSESAFAELVGRRLNMVYSAARRQVGGDAQLAEDVTQAVFTELARRSAALSQHPRLCGWLHRTTRYKAIDAVRAKRRRQVREGEAQTMNELLSSPALSADFAMARAVLDQAVDQLNQRDRDAVLLRFFEGYSFAEIGAQLHLKENAARMRVDRALDKLRLSLAKRGFTSTAGALALSLAAEAVTAAPAGLAARVAGAALAGAGAASGALTLIQIMSATKLKLGIAALVLAGGAATMVVQHQANVRLGDQNKEIDRLRRKIARLEQGAHPPTAPDEPGKLGQSAARRVAMGAAGQLSRQSVPLAAGLIPIQSLRNAGRATPGAAFQTQLWAARTGDIELTASAITFGPKARHKMEALLAELPANVHENYGTPELLMAFVLAGSPHPVGGMQVLGEQDDGPDSAVLQTRWQHEDDDVVHETNAQFQRSDDGWRLVVPMVLVDRAAQYLLRNPPQ